MVPLSVVAAAVIVAGLTFGVGKAAHVVKHAGHEIGCVVTHLHKCAKPKAAHKH